MDSLHAIRETIICCQWVQAQRQKSAKQYGILSNANHSYNFLLTSKTTIPRATHLTIFQFSLRNSYIASKSPVLSVGIS